MKRYGDIQKFKREQPSYHTNKNKKMIMYCKTEIAVVNVNPARQDIKKIYDNNPNDYTCVKDD